jgi:hypothetical protein
VETENAPHAGARPPASRARRGLIETAWLLLIMVIATLLFFARYEDPRRIAGGDSFWYMRQALIFTGVDPETARLQAAQQVCRDANRSFRASKVTSRCKVYTSTGFSPRYVAIFDSRPGYPMFAAPFVATLGAWTGMMAATLVLALIAAALAYLAVWLASGLRLAGVFAAAILFILPSGFAMTRMMTEGGVLAGYLAVVLGATLLVRGRRLGLPIVIVALTWLFLVRSASGMAMALTLLAAGVVTSFGRGRRRPGLTMGAVGVLAVAAWQAVSKVLHLPGLNDTIQDYATGHFKLHADVADPIGWLVDRNLTFWPEQLAAEAAEPTTIAALGFAVAVLLLRMRVTAVPWIFTGLTGVMMVVAHPMITQYDRLMVPLWLPVACAFGYAAALAIGRPAPATAAHPAGESPARPAIPPIPRQAERNPGQVEHERGRAAPALRIPLDINRA